VANVQGTGAIATVRLEKKIGALPKESLAKIKVALRYAFEL